MGRSDTNEIAAGRMQDSFGAACRARGVHDVERVLGVEVLATVIGRSVVDDVVPPHIGLVVPFDVLAGTTYDEDMAHVGTLGDGLVDGRLEGRWCTSAITAVRGDDDPGIAILDATGKRVGGEAAKHDGMRCAEPGAGEHRDDRLGDHRQVDRDAVTGLHAQIDERICGAGDVVLQFRIRDGASVVGRFADPVERDLVTVAGLDMAVDTVVGGVERAADKPFRERGVGPVEDFVERCAPGDAFGFLGPIRQPVDLGVVIRRGRDIRLCGERCRGIEVPRFICEVADGICSHGCSLVELLFCIVSHATAWVARGCREVTPSTTLATGLNAVRLSPRQGAALR